jgi:integrase
LQCLRRCFTLAVKKKKLNKGALPDFELLSEKDNVRTGYFEETDTRALLAELPDDGLRDFVRFASLSGWRKGSISKLLWSAVDLDANVVNIAGMYQKNGRALTMPIEGELIEVFARRLAAATIVGGKPKQEEPVFHRGDRKRILEYRKSWQTAAIKAELGTMVCPKCNSSGPEKTCVDCKCDRKYQGRILHDFRRTVARDSIRAGVDRTVAHKLLGHQTPAIFDRYNFTDSEDIADGMSKMVRYRKARAARKAKGNVTTMPRRARREAAFEAAAS